MSIQDDSIINRTSGVQSQPSAQNTGWSFHDVGPVLSPIPKNIGSEYYIQFKDKLIEIYKSAHPDVEIGVIELSRELEPSLDFSCIVVATRLRHHTELGVAFHILLLARTGEEIAPYTETLFDRTVTVYRVPSDAINKILIGKAFDRVKKAYNTNNVYFVDGTVVPSSFDPENKTSIQKMSFQNLALNSAMAGVTELTSRLPGFQDINLAKLARGNQSVVEINFFRQTLHDVVMNPVRSDMIITFTDRKTADGNRDRQLNSGDKQVKFSEISSFMDVLWYPIGNKNDGLVNAFMPQSLASTQRYVARQVITDLSPNYSQTPGAVLLALSTALAMRDPSIWIQAFRPQLGDRNKIDMTDIGALNIEGNIPVLQPSGILAPDPSGHGRPIDTKADDFKNEQLGFYMGALFHPDTMLALDVPEYGPQTQYLGIFAAAAAGASGAISKILDAANELTNGGFAKCFDSSKPMFATASERIHAGTWVDTEGQVRDLRDFDYTAVANLVGAQNPSFIRDFSDTFLRTDYPEIQRLEARRKMLSMLSNETAKYTGFYQRVTFSGEFLRALEQAISAHNLRATVRTPMSGTDFYNHRGVANYASNALLGRGVSYMQQGGFNPTRGSTAGYNQARY